MVAGSAPGSRHIGSQHALRRQNTDLVLRTLASRGPTTQARLVRLTGLSTGTISNIVKALEEDQRVSLTPTVDRGRRALEVSLCADRRLVLALEVQPEQVRWLAARFDQTVVAQGQAPVNGTSTPAPVLAQIARESAVALSEAGASVDDIAASSLCLPSWAGHGSASETGRLDDRWAADDLEALAAEHLPGPISVVGSAEMSALAQVSWGPFTSAQDLLHVHVGSQIHAGMLIAGRLHRGRLGLTGGLAHFPINDIGDHCSCGNRGCLATIASTGAIAHALRRSQRSGNRLDESGIVALARTRDLPTVRVLEDAGAALGTALGAIANLLTPEVIVIGGPLAPVGAPLLDPLMRSLDRHALPEVMEQTHVTMSQLGDRAALMGAATAALRAVPHTL